MLELQPCSSIFFFLSQTLSFVVSLKNTHALTLAKEEEGFAVHTSLVTPPWLHFLPLSHFSNNLIYNG
jgi:hypothetical protein